MPADHPLVLVTGVTGFIGRHLAPVLAARGVRVRGVTRRAPAPVVPGVAEWVVTGDLGPDTDWRPALAGVSAVVHLAALAHQTDPRRQPAEADYLRVNAAATGALAAAAARGGSVRRLVFLSSIGAVTDMCNTPIHESAVAGPVTPYGRSKLAAERVLRETLAGSAVEWSVLRPVLVYGPGNPGNMARLVRLVRSGLPLPLGGIANRRSFLFVGNLVEAIDRVLVAPGVAGRTFHVADDEVVSTADLIRLLAAASGRRVRLWSAPAWSLRLAARCGDLAGRFGLNTGLNSYSLDKLEESLVVSNRALDEVTGWKPRTTLFAGLQATLAPAGAAGR